MDNDIGRKLCFIILENIFERKYEYFLEIFLFFIGYKIIKKWIDGFVCNMEVMDEDSIIWYKIVLG